MLLHVCWTGRQAIPHHNNSITLCVHVSLCFSALNTTTGNNLVSLGHMQETVTSIANACMQHTVGLFSHSISGSPVFNVLISSRLFFFTFLSS